MQHTREGELAKAANAPVVVLCSAQRMGHALNGVHDGAGEVVGGVGLVLGTLRYKQRR